MEPEKLPAELMARLATRGNVRRYARGETVVREGSRAGGLYVVRTGRLDVFTADTDGRELIYNTLHPGEILGEMFLDGGARSASVRAVTESECVLIDEQEMFAIVRSDPEFNEFVVRTLIRRLRHATALIRQLGLHDVSQRVLDVLRTHAQVVDGRTVLPPSLTQHDIAQRVGATREMVNHVIRKLTQLGYLRRTGRRDVEIVRELPEAMPRGLDAESAPRREKSQDAPPRA